MYVQLTLLVAYLLLLQIVVNLPSTLPSHPRPQELQDTRASQASLFPLYKHDEDAETSVMAGSSKRDDDEDDLGLRRMDILTSTVPIIEATPNLHRLYNIVLYNALGTWTNMPPQYALSISLGCLQLDMSVAMNTGPPRGIPWAFVRNFARNMIVMTHMGFAGTYNMYYSSSRGAFMPEFVIEVKLRVCWARIGQHIPPQEQPGRFPRATQF